MCVWRNIISRVFNSPSRFLHLVLGVTMRCEDQTLRQKGGKEVSAKRQHDDAVVPRCTTHTPAHTHDRNSCRHTFNPPRNLEPRTSCWTRNRCRSEYCIALEHDKSITGRRSSGSGRCEAMTIPLFYFLFPLKRWGRVGGGLLFVYRPDVFVILCFCSFVCLFPFMPCSNK